MNKHPRNIRARMSLSEERKIREYYLIIGMMLLFALVLTGCANQAAASGSEAPDPQKLLIPRWFLYALELDGQDFEIAEGQQRMTLQFQEDGSANGGGGCNNFFTSYEVDQEGGLKFAPIGATKMFCEDYMQLETAYFDALARVNRFYFDDYRLVLVSDDEQVKLTFVMPPK